jgi:hypothetical protein
MPSYLQAYPSAIYGNPPPAGTSTGAQRESTTKAAILSTLPVGGFKGIALSVVPTIVAWSDQPVQQLSVNGSHPRSFAESGVVLTAPVEEIGAGSLPAGVITGRLLDVEGDAQPQAGPPGMVVLAKGSVTYSFVAPLASGARLSGVSIMSTNPFGFKGGVPGSETPSTLTGEVWDWTQSAWIPVNYMDSGATTVPEAGVNPTTGEVRLRLSSNGGFASGWLSLTGTVK